MGVDVTEIEFMAGSRTWRSYTSDSGAQYSIQIDESNARAIPTAAGSAGSELCPVRTANAPRLPKGLKLRYVNAYNQANPAEKRRFIVGTTSQIPIVTAPGATIVSEDYPGAGDTPGTTATWIVRGYRGEKVDNAPSFSAPDTGLTDATTTQ
jgi:hypothetical protein